MNTRTWVCFTCRKTYNREHRHCPNCSGEVHFIGRYFKPPKASKDKEWETIEMLFKAGFRFQNMTGRTPRHPRDVPRFLECEYIQGWLKHWKHYGV